MQLAMRPVGLNPNVRGGFAWGQSSGVLANMACALNVLNICPMADFKAPWACFPCPSGTNITCKSHPPSQGANKTAPNSLANMIVVGALTLQSIA